MNNYVSNDVSVEVNQEHLQLVSILRMSLAIGPPLCACPPPTLCTSYTYFRHEIARKSVDIS